IDVENAARAVPVRVGEDLVDHRVGDERALPRLESVGDGGEGGVEVRVRDAAAMAGPAVVAGGAAVDGPGDVGGASQGHRPPELVLHAVAEQGLDAGEAHGRVEAAVRQLVHA